MLFKPDSSGINPGVILQGKSGNGISLTVQKMMMDWACDLHRTKLDVVFHVKCKEISHISSRTTSLVELLSYNIFLTSEEISTILQRSPERVLFLVDGFDELKYTEDFYRMLPPTDQYQRAPPEVTLCALLRGRILQESCLLVTTRSTAVDILKNVLKEPHSFTEIIGFSEKGVEEYFKKSFQNGILFRKGYKYVRANETLLTACSIPVICWIICMVIRERLNDGTDVTSGLEATTSIYVDFLCTLLASEHHSQGLGQSVPILVKSLGRLADKGILAQQVLFDEKTVFRCSKSSKECKDLVYPYNPADYSCNQKVKIRLNKQGFFAEPLRKGNKYGAKCAKKFLGLALHLCQKNEKNLLFKS
ncbi:hypothetical protein QQF64_015562 [Cirrhinus molitorella]|uniref:NACHT domain-containing protein n=1 Tax=Cirrhinus molitorella TaxID=172907 RepID=A0ABR3NW18_9TELE